MPTSRMQATRRRAGDGDHAGRRRRCGSAARSPGRSTPACGRRARTARWCARWPATRPTTDAGPAPGSSRRCSRRGRSPATRSSGARYLETIAPLVWTAAERPNFVDDVRAMRRRVLAHVQPAIADRELKLGPGGLRDVEFAVQLLQLVHGRGEESLQVPGTLAALAALRDGGFVGRDDAMSLIDAYTFLRATEHRLQLRRLRRTHLLPDDPQRAGLARPEHGLPAGRTRRRPAGVGGRARAARPRGPGCSRTTNAPRVRPPPRWKRRSPATRSARTTCRCVRSRIWTRSTRSRVASRPSRRSTRRPRTSPRVRRHDREARGPDRRRHLALRRPRKAPRRSDPALDRPRVA